MNVFVVYAHPSDDSFTFLLKESLVKGLADAGHTVTVSDLYKMNFLSTFSESEYKREAYYDLTQPIPDDVTAEQQKINAADVIAFVYPVFWTEAPEKLVGWFQRVWTYGFAYGPSPTMKTLEKALFFATMGGSVNDPVRVKQIDAMKTVMIGDRLHNRANTSEFYVFDEMTRGYGNDENRAARIKTFTEKAYKIGLDL